MDRSKLKRNMTKAFPTLGLLKRPPVIPRSGTPTRNKEPKIPNMGVSKVISQRIPLDQIFHSVEEHKARREKLKSQGLLQPSKDSEINSVSQRYKKSGPNSAEERKCAESLDAANYIISIVMKKVHNLMKLQRAQEISGKYTGKSVHHHFVQTLAQSCLSPDRNDKKPTQRDTASQPSTNRRRYSKGGSGVTLNLLIEKLKVKKEEVYHRRSEMTQIRENDGYMEDVEDIEELSQSLEEEQSSPMSSEENAILIKPKFPLKQPSYRIEVEKEPKKCPMDNMQMTKYKAQMKQVSELVPKENKTWYMNRITADREDGNESFKSKNRLSYLSSTSPLVTKKSGRLSDRRNTYIDSSGDDSNPPKRLYSSGEDHLRMPSPNTQLRSKKSFVAKRKKRVFYEPVPLNEYYPGLTEFTLRSPGEKILIQEPISEETESFIYFKRKQLKRKYYSGMSPKGLGSSDEWSIQSSRFTDSQSLLKTRLQKGIKDLQLKEKAAAVKDKKGNVHNVIFDSYGSILNLEKDVMLAKKLKNKNHARLFVGANPIFDPKGPATETLKTRPSQLSIVKRKREDSSYSDESSSMESDEFDFPSLRQSEQSPGMLLATEGQNSENRGNNSMIQNFQIAPKTATNRSRGEEKLAGALIQKINRRKSRYCENIPPLDPNNIFQWFKYDENHKDAITIQTGPNDTAADPSSRVIRSIDHELYGQGKGQIMNIKPADQRVTLSYSREQTPRNRRRQQQGKKPKENRVFIRGPQTVDTSNNQTRRARGELFAKPVIPKETESAKSKDRIDSILAIQNLIQDKDSRSSEGDISQSSHALKSGQDRILFFGEQGCQGVAKTEVSPQRQLIKSYSPIKREQNRLQSLQITQMNTLRGSTAVAGSRAKKGAFIEVSSVDEGEAKRSGVVSQQQLVMSKRNERAPVMKQTNQRHHLRVKAIHQVVDSETLMSSLDKVKVKESDVKLKLKANAAPTRRKSTLLDSRKSTNSTNEAKLKMDEVSTTMKAFLPPDPENKENEGFLNRVVRIRTEESPRTSHVASMLSKSNMKKPGSRNIRKGNLITSMTIKNSGTTPLEQPKHGIRGQHVPVSTLVGTRKQHIQPEQAFRNRMRQESSCFSRALSPNGGNAEASKKSITEVAKLRARYGVEKEYDNMKALDELSQSTGVQPSIYSRHHEQFQKKVHEIRRQMKRGEKDNLEVLLKSGDTQSKMNALQLKKYFDKVDHSKYHFSDASTAFKLKTSSQLHRQQAASSSLPSRKGPRRKVCMSTDFTEGTSSKPIPIDATLSSTISKHFGLQSTLKPNRGNATMVLSMMGSAIEKGNIHDTMSQSLIKKGEARVPSLTIDQEKQNPLTEFIHSPA